MTQKLTLITFLSDFTFPIAVIYDNVEQECLDVELDEQMLF